MDKQNTESDFVQGQYKIIKSTSGYPALTQSNIVKNVRGVYQYELARFRTGSSGITSFQDMRTFLDFDSIYEQIEKEIENIKDGSAFMQRSNFAVITGTMTLAASSEALRYKQTTKDIDFPTGFNKDNCVLISAGRQYADNSGYGYGVCDFVNAISTGMLTGAAPFVVWLGSNSGTKIRIYGYNVNTSQQILNYKLVLMKI